MSFQHLNILMFSSFFCVALLSSSGQVSAQSGNPPAKANVPADIGKPDWTANIESIQRPDWSVSPDLLGKPDTTGKPDGEGKPDWASKPAWAGQPEQLTGRPDWAMRPDDPQGLSDFRSGQAKALGDRGAQIRANRGGGGRYR